MNVVKIGNNTTRFILPLIFPDNTTHSQILPKDFIKAFLADIDNGEHDNQILVLLNSMPTESDKEFVKLAVDSYVKETLSVYCFELPDKFLEDYHLFLAGKYSDLSEDAKQRILEFWEEDDESLLHGILFKSEPAISYWEDKTGKGRNQLNIDDELWFAPVMRMEILGYE